MKYVFTAQRSSVCLYKEGLLGALGWFEELGRPQLGQLISVYILPPSPFEFCGVTQPQRCTFSTFKHLCAPFDAAVPTSYCYKWDHA